MSARKPIEHGTDGGSQAHRRRGEQPCDACRVAHAAYVRSRRQPKPRQLHPCGTPAAYMRHWRRGEEACEPCLVAHRTYIAELVKQSRVA